MFLESHFRARKFLAILFVKLADADQSVILELADGYASGVVGLDLFLL